jgi:hypothetical protein
VAPKTSLDAVGTLLLPEIETGFSNLLKPSLVAMMTELTRTVKQEVTKQQRQIGKITKFFMKNKSKTTEK